MELAPDAPEFTGQFDVGPSAIEYLVPFVTPPSAENNPNVWKSSQPPGAVFIFVGAVAAGVFLVLIIWYLVTEHISRRETRKSHYEGVEELFKDEYTSAKDAFAVGLDMASDPTPPYAEVKPKPVVDPIIAPPSLFGFNALNSPADRYPAPEDERRLEDLRRSMYISPTVEVMNLRRHRKAGYEMPGSSFDVQSMRTFDMLTPALSAAERRRSRKFNRSRYPMNSVAGSVLEPIDGL
ncbi:AaceriADL251Cp [[Ashbya] aceris (nom. inval.)]|nr:AaceriADL251Cp [[Ashbya] aceris (nom. inval.)]